MAKVISKEDSAVNQLMDSKATDKIYRRLDEHQRYMYECLSKFKVTFVDEPAGTGKTTIAVLAGVEAMRSGRKLIYIRFPSKRGEKLGATPGELEDKEKKYMHPFYEALNECGLQDEAIETLKLKNYLETRTDTTERGRNIKGAFVIIDEAQNAEDVDQLQLIFTRLHDDCNAVVVGHSAQADSKIRKYGSEKLNAFQVYRKHMTKKNWATECVLVRNYRGAISRWADEVKETLSEIGDE